MLIKKVNNVLRTIFGIRDKARAIEQQRGESARQTEQPSESTDFAVDVSVPDREAYRIYKSGRPIFLPWTLDSLIRSVMTDLIRHDAPSLVNWDRMWVVKSGFLQAKVIPGEVWEMGCTKEAPPFY